MTARTRGALAAAALSALTVATAAPGATAPAPATQTTTTSTGGGIKFGQPGMPIDVTSNSTQVFQQEGRAVYIGDVEAVQGTTRLRTPRLELWYNTDKGAKQPNATARAGSAPSNTIKRMEADGTVYYVTATQSAKGDHGSYLASDNTITLVGNVILTQDKNVSTGDKLVIHQDLNTADLTSQKAGGRVRGVFYNEDKAKPAAGAAAAPAPSPAR